ncbi:HNH endonuclease [Gordonia phage DumpsterDude]|uniref:HNH endonuclease n=1 Tax=Gordonia phage DumpsterDude TaxID=2713262 RepID=A0A6G8R0B8_9CAUD|nr:endonuclease [Gordonia phage DumpsterDude]QIN93650.1 HNH endonuclease [Gordonia phage DumpsterDude]
MRPCSLPDCARPHRRNGLCDMHDRRMKRTGTTDSPVKSLAERFWAKVDKDGPVIRPELGKCWVWTGATKDGGYGVIRPSGQRSGPPAKAHRVSAEFAGMDVAGRFVLHACDNPPCVNPAHLRPGAPIDNVEDMVSRGRQGRGETSGTNKLTGDQVSEIRELVAAGMLHREVAERFGVARSNVTRIVNRQGWSHVA